MRIQFEINIKNYLLSPHQWGALDYLQWQDLTQSQNIRGATDTLTVLHETRGGLTHWAKRWTTWGAITREGQTTADQEVTHHLQPTHKGNEDRTHTDTTRSQRFGVRITVPTAQHTPDGSSHRCRSCYDNGPSQYNANPNYCAAYTGRLLSQVPILLR